MPKPKMKLIGEDGNIYFIMARARRLLTDAGLGNQADEMEQRVRASGDYYKALWIISEYVETELKV